MLGREGVAAIGGGATVSPPYGVAARSRTALRVFFFTPRIGRGFLLYTRYRYFRADAFLTCTRDDLALLPGGSRVPCLIYDSTCVSGWICIIVVT